MDNLTLTLKSSSWGDLTFDSTEWDQDQFFAQEAIEQEKVVMQRVEALEPHKIASPLQWMQKWEALKFNDQEFVTFVKELYTQEGQALIDNFLEDAFDEEGQTELLKLAIFSALKGHAFKWPEKIESLVGGSFLEGSATLAALIAEVSASVLERGRIPSILWKKSLQPSGERIYSTELLGLKFSLPFKVYPCESIQTSKICLIANTRIILGQGGFHKVKIWSSLLEAKPDDYAGKRTSFSAISLQKQLMNIKGVQKLWGETRYQGKNKNKECVIEKRLSFSPIALGSLEKFIKNEALSVDARLELCYQSILAMNQMHTRGFHGDIKLENILVYRDKNKKLIVAFSDLDGFNNKKGPCTLCFASKERRSAIYSSGSGDFDFKAMDVYALGLTCAFLMAGTNLPLNRKKEMQLSLMDRLDLVPSITEELVDLAFDGIESPKKEPLKELLLGMVFFDPERRLKSFEAAQKAEEIINPSSSAPHPLK